MPSDFSAWASAACARLWYSSPLVMGRPVSLARHQFNCRDEPTAGCVELAHLNFIASETLARGVPGFNLADDADEERWRRTPGQRFKTPVIPAVGPRERTGEPGPKGVRLCGCSWVPAPLRCGRDDGRFSCRVEREEGRPS